MTKLFKAGKGTEVREKFDLVLENATLFSKSLLCMISKPRISKSEVENLLHNEIKVAGNRSCMTTFYESVISIH